MGDRASDEAQRGHEAGKGKVRIAARDSAELVSSRPFSQIAAVQPAVKSEFVSVADYLAAEETSPVRHEYLGGLVYAMAGETRTHNLIAGNIYVAARRRLRGKPCRVFMADVRVNLNLRSDEYYYYPDVVVTCDKRDTHPRFLQFPKLIVEVLSESTERVDKREKFFAYTNIQSLQEYVLVARDRREVAVFRRANGWKAEPTAGAKATVRLDSLGVKISLAAIYEGV